jgi:cobalt/nickel transport system permease protein
MAGLAIDDAAWASRWRDRGLLDKAVLSLGLVLAALALPAWPGSLLVGMSAVVIAVRGSGAPPRLLLRALRAPLVFIVLGALSVAIVVAAEPQWSISVTPDSLTRAASVAGHAVAGTLALLLLALSTPMVEVLGGLRRLRVPAACVEVAALMYRLLFILLDTTHNMRDSQRARLGYSSPSRSLKSAGSLTAAVLLRSWDRARRLEQGLAGRGYSTSMTTLHTPPANSPVFIAVTLAGLLALAAVSLLIGGLT